MKFSPSTGSFYPSEINYGDDLPSDLVPASDNDFSHAMEARAAGRQIDYVDGAFVATAPPEVPFSTIAKQYMVEVRSLREPILNRLPGIGMAAMAMGDSATLEAVLSARTALLAITEAPGVSEAENLDSLKGAVLAEYRRIVAAAPHAVKTSFKDMAQ